MNCMNIRLYMQQEQGVCFLQFMEWFLVEGIVKGITVSIRLLAKLGAKMQNGQTQSYGVVAFVGLALLVVIYALTGG